MCSLVLLIRPGHEWPLIAAANRDEMIDRPWDPPAPWWPEQPNVLAGRDRLGGGTWLALKRDGMIAAVLNRPQSLGPQAGKASRGALPLAALRHDSAAEAAWALAGVDASAWRSFHLVIADRAGAFYVPGDGIGALTVRALAPGLRMITTSDPDDVSCPRIARHRPRFTAAVPDPARGEWESWRAILADSSPPAGSEMTIPLCQGFGTICASLFALPRSGDPVWLFAPGPADHTPFVGLSWVREAA